MRSTKYQERAQKFALAAAQLFASGGYKGTSTREIARLAGTAETTLFRYFTSKENLFWAALQTSLARLELPQELIQELEANGPPEQLLPRVIAQIVEVTLVQPELIRLMAVGYLEMGEKAAEVCRPSLGPLLGAIKRYLSDAVLESAQKGLDPYLLTGAIVATAAFSGILGQSLEAGSSHASDSEKVRAVSQFWTGVFVAVREGALSEGRLDLVPQSLPVAIQTR